MTAVLVPKGTPNFIALSTDVSGSKISGVSIVGAHVYLTDTKVWRIVNADLTLTELIWPAA